ncbi:MAG TPA: hypothetical protein VF599_16390 [Pyrinomonadaceae bacterium]|jgi:hypothetical protein
MKTVFKFLSLGMMLMVFAVAPAFAQEECEGLYKKWLDNYKGTPEQKQTAVDAGKEFISKCNTPEQAEIIKYLQVQVPKLEGTLKSGKNVECFNTAVKDAKTVNADNAFRCGKEILASAPDQIDVPLVLASIGFDKAVAKPPVDTYNAEAINYARQAIQKIEGGKTSTQYGAYGYAYGSKENALAWMNYTVGYITYFNQKNKKEALPYLYKATQYNTGKPDNPKNLPLIYQAIGDYYKDEYNRLDDERVKLAAEAKDKTPEEAKVLADKAKALLLLQKGYAERMIDAYGRARSFATTDKPYQEALSNNLKVLYGFRFDGKTDGLDAYVSGLTGKPMPDPTSAVTPVIDTTPTTTTATTPSSTSSLTTTPTSNTTTTNARTSTTADTSVTKQATTTTTKAKTTTKTPAKTTAPKKKGTR